ncbi:hypothetical protein [Coralliovum pocilloporae]|uniref:hypothetical protein n=1 Tax=Coralliovum pocilloporae TaxID=3066369 RepID=UPI003306EA7E
MKRDSWNALDLDLLRREARSLNRTADRETAVKITADHHKLRRIQVRRFERDKDKRIETMKNRIAKEKGINFDSIKHRRDLRSRRLTHAVTSRATKEVMLDHRRRIDHINNAEGKKLTVLIETAHQRERLARENPNQPSPPKQLTDQRQSPDRLPFPSR